MQDGLCAGFSIGAPTLLAFAPPEVRERYLPDVLRGEKRICLAITEPYAGSDVANIKCTARKTHDGKHFVVSGQKKWITGGVDADIFVTAVRTGGKGMGGITMLLIERSKGVATDIIKTSYAPAAGTSYVTFDEVLVPVENVFGKENQGFKCIMKNFNRM